MLTTTTTSTSEYLTTVPALKAMLGITTTSQDDDLDDTVLAASDACATYVGYWPLRARYTETVAGYGSLRLMLSATPVRQVGAITIGDQLVDPATYVVEKPSAGILYRDLGWPWTAGVEYDLEAHVVPNSELKSFAVDYEAGWVLTTSTGTLNAAGFITSSGGRTLPRDFESAVLEQAKSDWLGRRRDATITTKRVGALSVTYDTQGANGASLVSTALALLGPYRRLK